MEKSTVAIYGRPAPDKFDVYVDGRLVYPRSFSIQVTEGGLAEAILYFSISDLQLEKIPRASDGVRAG